MNLELLDIKKKVQNKESITQEELGKLSDEVKRNSSNDNLSAYASAKRLVMKGGEVQTTAAEALAGARESTQPEDAKMDTAESKLQKLRNDMIAAHNRALGGGHPSRKVEYVYAKDLYNKALAESADKGRLGGGAV